MESSFSSLSLGPHSASAVRERQRFVSQRSDPFDINSMLSSITDSNLHTSVCERKQKNTNYRDSNNFSLQSLGQALFDDLRSNSADTEMSNSQSWPAATPEPIINDVEMEDVSVLSSKPSETDPLPASPRKSILRTTTETLLSPTAKGAELALGLSAIPAKPSKKTTTSENTATKSTSPIICPVLEPQTTSILQSERQVDTFKSTSNSKQISVLPSVSLRASTTETQTDTNLQELPNQSSSTVYPSSNNHYHQHHYAVSLPQPWQESLQESNTRKHNTLYIISSYLQIFSNFLFASFLTYSLYNIFQIFLNDVSSRRFKYVTAAIAEAERCSREYVRNECRLDLRAPLLEEQCNDWEICMDTDPELAVGTLKVHAEVLSEIMNSFIEGFTMRSLIIGLSTASLVFGIIYVSNFAFGYWRAKLYYNQAQVQQPVEMGTLKLK